MNVTEKNALQLFPELASTTWRRKLLRAVRVVDEEGEPIKFAVKTGRRTQTCEDGYLALDDAARPFAIPRDVFEETFERI